jgi:hypothetical protein
VFQVVTKQKHYWNTEKIYGDLIAAAGIPPVAYREVRHVTEDFDFRAKNTARCYVVSPKSTPIRHGHWRRWIDLANVRQERVLVVG